MKNAASRKRSKENNRAKKVKDYIILDNGGEIMAVRQHTTIDSRNYYFSSFNPTKVFQSLQSAQNYERLYYLDESFEKYLILRDVDGNQINFDYDPQLTYFYEPRISMLQERETAEPIFYYDGDNQNDKPLSFFLDYADTLEIRIPTYEEEEGLSLAQRTKKLNKMINTLNRYWEIGLPYTPGVFKYSKKNGWTKN